MGNATRAQVEAALPAIKTELMAKYEVTESQIGLAIEETSTRRRLAESTTITLIVTITTESRTAATTLANKVDAANAANGGISTLGGLNVDSYTSAGGIYVNPDDDDGLSGGAIAGIAVGTCAGVALIAVIAVVAMKKRASRGDEEEVSKRAPRCEIRNEIGRPFFYGRMFFRAFLFVRESLRGSCEPGCKSTTCTSRSAGPRRWDRG